MSTRTTDGTNQWLALEPGDAWFFRDGRPYHAGEANQANVRSEFPPNARTLMGALRAALARANGWNGHSNWKVTIPELTPVLGDGPDDFGKLTLRGPWLVRGGDLLLPAPAHLVSYQSKADGKPQFGLLRPGDKKVRTDHGDIRLPSLPGDQHEKVKAQTGHWVTAKVLQKLLAGDASGLVETDSFPAKNLWKFEPRVGVQRDSRTLRVEDGMLFSPEFVRLAKDVRLVCELRGVPSHWQPLPGIFPFGGEGRTALCEVLEKAPELPVGFTPQPDGPTLIYLATPVPLPPSENGLFQTPKVGEDLFGIPGLTLVSACCERPVFIGGWDFTKQAPVAPQPYLPAGSVFFCDAKGLSQPPSAPDLSPAECALGLGDLHWGSWPAAV